MPSCFARSNSTPFLLDYYNLGNGKKGPSSSSGGGSSCYICIITILLKSLLVATPEILWTFELSCPLTFGGGGCWLQHVCPIRMLITTCGFVSWNPTFVDHVCRSYYQMGLFRFKTWTPSIEIFCCDGKETTWCRNPGDKEWRWRLTGSDGGLWVNLPLILLLWFWLSCLSMTDSEIIHCSYLFYEFSVYFTTIQVRLGERCPLRYGTTMDHRGVPTTAHRMR